ncbi:MAG: hypothetical protein M1536_03945 [Firmicutes bacterium]|nr:hypothetical protein [Bacillota bacterium]
MIKSKKGKKVIHSMEEFEKEYFPKSFEKRMLESTTDARALGIRFAKVSLDKIKAQLAK